MLEAVLKKDEVDNWNQARLRYHSSVPLYLNCSEIPPEPPPPDWLQDLIDDLE